MKISSVCAITSRKELSHYSKATTDFEFLFPFGWGELWGIADRTDFDLKSHAQHSGEKAWNIWIRQLMKNISPYCVSPPWGADRVTLASLCGAYDEETLENVDVRLFSVCIPPFAPFKCAVPPLQKNKLGR